jgi:hypothetical protein
MHCVRLTFAVAAVSLSRRFLSCILHPGPENVVLTTGLSRRISEKYILSLIPLVLFLCDIFDDGSIVVVSHGG